MDVSEVVFLVEDVEHDLRPLYIAGADQLTDDATAFLVVGNVSQFGCQKRAHLFALASQR